MLDLEMQDIQKKTPIHIGLFGHIDSGKTAIAAVLSEIISTAGNDAHPQSKERGITIDLGFSSLVLDDYLITLVDGPGHADLIKISASSVEIIDCALMVIDINKGPQIQTGEHLIIIEALGIKDIIVVLNKIDIFKGNVQNAIDDIREFFKSTSFGENVPIYAVSAKEKLGFEELKEGIIEKIKSLSIKRNITGDVIIPIDHHFLIKGRGGVITGTILKGTLNLNQILKIVPVETEGRVKNIQIFRQDVSSAKSGDRIGVNLKGVDIKKIHRGCYATTNKDAFEYSDLIEIQVNTNSLFKPETHFGTQVHVTIGMFTAVGFIYPFNEIEGKRIRTDIKSRGKSFSAFLWLNEKVLMRKDKAIFLLSRLDLPPTTLRIMGTATLIKICKTSPKLYRYKSKTGSIQNPNHSQGIVCSGLARSLEGAKKIVGKDLEPPFSKIIGTFGTKGSVIIGLEIPKKDLSKGEKVVLKELRSFELKPKKDLNFQN